MKPIAALALPCLLALATPALAAAPRIDASMLLSGHIVVSPQGTVRSYTLDQSRQVPPAVNRLLAESIPRWRFVPVTQHGMPVAARAVMRVRVVARPSTPGSYRLSVAGASFGDRHGDPHATFHFDQHGRPRYPREAAMQNVSGTVYLVMRIDRQGRVERIASEEVDLRTRGPSSLMRRWRHVLSSAAIATAKRWTFTVPSEGPLARKDHWVVRVPVNYVLRHPGRPPRFHYAEWIGYLPGPHHQIPWLEPDERNDAGDKALAPGDLAVAGAGLQRVPIPHS